MFSLRGSTWFILFFWLASMGWLGWAKLRPLARQGEPPQQDDILPRDAVRAAPIRWRISLGDQTLGWASHDVERLADGQGRLESTVRIERLSIDQILQRGFGSLGSLLSRGLNREQFGGLGPISLTIQNSVRFDHFGQLESFESLVSEDTWGECIRLSGSVREAELLVKAYLVLAAEQGEPRLEPVYQNVLPLPPDKLVIDSLAPRPRLSHLRVGQRWTFESYHPFFPTRPLQTVEAQVVDRRMLRIEDRDVWTFHVVYRRGEDDGLSLERHLGDVYVMSDGTVVRQTLTWGGATLAFDLMSEPNGGPGIDNGSGR
jgi:hypothetical protein